MFRVVDRKTHEVVTREEVKVEAEVKVEVEVQEEVKVEAGEVVYPTVGGGAPGQEKSDVRCWRLDGRSVGDGEG